MSAAGGVLVWVGLRADVVLPCQQGGHPQEFQAKGRDEEWVRAAVAAPGKQAGEPSDEDAALHRTECGGVPLHTRQRGPDDRCRREPECVGEAVLAVQRSHDGTVVSW